MREYYMSRASFYQKGAYIIGYFGTSVQKKLRSCRPYVDRHNKYLDTRLRNRLFWYKRTGKATVTVDRMWTVSMTNNIKISRNIADEQITF